MEMTTQHQKDMFNFIHYNSHELVERSLPSNSKNRRPGIETKKQNPKQNNTKQLRINVKNGVQMRLQECNKNISAAGSSSTHQNNF